MTGLPPIVHSGKCICKQLFAKTCSQCPNIDHQWSATDCQPLFFFVSKIFVCKPSSIFPWTIVHGPAPWTMVHGPWSMDDGPWTMVHGLWSMVYGPWSMVHGPWSILAEKIDFGKTDFHIGFNPWGRRAGTSPPGPRLPSMDHGPWTPSSMDHGPWTMKLWIL